MDQALLNRIVSVITVAHSGAASIDERRAEVALFDELRNSTQIQSVIQVAVALTTGSGLAVTTSEYVSSQLTLMGYGVLQHVVGNRWEELSAQDRDSMVGLCFSLLEGLCSPGGAGGAVGTEQSQPQQQLQLQLQNSALKFALRSKCAVLFAVVIKRHGAAYASESVKRLIADEAKYASVLHAKSTYQAIVSLVFRYLVDEVYQFAGDMGGAHARDMLVCMATWFPEILRFTVNALEANYKVYSSGEGHDAQDRKNAMFAVKTALESGALYGEVAPAGAMYASDFIKAAGYFLSLPAAGDPNNNGIASSSQQDIADLKSSSCEILKNVGSRRKTSDENDDDFCGPVLPPGYEDINAGTGTDDQPTTATFSSEHRVPVRVAGRHDERGLASCSLPPYAHSPNTHPPTHSPTYFFFFFPVVFLGSCAGTARQGGHRPGYRSAGRSSADGVDRLQGQAV